MDYSLLFNPVTLSSLDLTDRALDPQQLASYVMFYNPEAPVDLQEAQIAIVGVPESRNSYRNGSCSLAPDEIRRQFYQLYPWQTQVRIIDMGNLILGKTIEDTYEVLSDVIADMLENKVIPIILGGGNDLAFANYRAYEKLEKVVNIVAVDSCFDLGAENQPIRSDAYLNKMVLQQPNFLLNYANIGYQCYMNSPESIKLMEDLFFETYRVGTMRVNIEEVEPIVRNADMVSLDISAVRRPDAPGEYDPTLDYNNQTSQLIGHIIWYFVEGYLHRQQDNQFKNRQNYRQYSIAVSGALDEMVFYCSRKTERWWVEVPIISKNKDLVQKYYLPCSKRDYKLACDDKVSDRWWKAYNKLNH